MDKITRKNSFGQWFSPINSKVFEEQVKTLNLDFYTKKLTTELFLKLLLFAQLQEFESLHALSDCLFDDKLQKAINLDSLSHLTIVGYVILRFFSINQKNNYMEAIQNEKHKKTYHLGVII